MKTLKFAGGMLAREYRKSIFYAVTLVFQIAMTFIFFTISTNPYLADPVELEEGLTATTFVASLSLVIIIFCCSMVLFASDFYVSKKNKEFAVLSLSGWNAFKVGEYVLLQIGSLLLLATPVGLLLGYGVAVLSNYFMYQQAGIAASPFYIPMAAWLQTVVVLLFMLVMIIMISSGYVYRNNIRDYLGQVKSMQPRPSATLGRTIVYSALYLLGLLLIGANDYHDPYFFQIFVGMAGAAGLMSGGIPFIIEKMKASRLLTRRYALIYASHLRYTLQKSAILAGGMVIAVTSLITLMMTEQDNPRIFSIVVIGYVVIVVLLVTSLVYNYFNEIQQRMKMFSNLWNIGYTKKELRRIIISEVGYYYGILLLLPLVYMIGIGGRYVRNGSMDLGLFIMIILAYIVPMIISSGIVYRAYTNMVIKPIEGAN